MKRIITLLFLLAFIKTTINAQTPGIKWQKCIGGASIEDRQWDGLKVITKNGHYVIAGSTFSTDGDIEYNHGNNDVFVGDMDVLGNWIWKKTYGGPQWENVTSIISTSDNGFIFLAETSSSDGDVTGNHGENDLWVVKLDSLGNILWQKCYGGSHSEHGGRILNLEDSGFAFVGTTASSDGDVTFTRPYNNYISGGDIWIVRIDKDGNKLWDNCFGSSDLDYGYDIKSSKNGGFNILGIVLGYDYDGAGKHVNGRNWDSWFAELDSNGNLVSSKLLGGTLDDVLLSFIPSDNNSFILVGTTYSNDGDVSGNHGNADAWIVKIDSSKNIIWQRCLGGSSSLDFYDESFKDILIDSNENYIVCGYTNSNDGDVFYNHGGTDAWIVNVSKNGNLLWEKSFGGTNRDLFTSITSQSNKEVLLYGLTGSNDQDVSDNHGDYDIWLTRLGMVNTMIEYTYYDWNSNNTKDSTEKPFTYGKLIVKSNTDSLVSITSNGNFRIDVDTGTYISSFAPFNEYYKSVPTSDTSVFFNYNHTDTVYFALQPVNDKRDIGISMLPLTTVRPGLNVTYKMQYQNVGTDTISNGVIQLIKDSRLTYISSSKAHLSINGDTIKWSYSDLKPLDTAYISVSFNLPHNVNIGDTIRSTATISPIESDLSPNNDTALVTQIVVGSFDPNNKSENHAGTISKNEVTNGNYLTYIIRFQNTGTYAAFNIVVKDTLSDKLDWNTLQMVDASHNYQLNISDGNTCTWYFNGISLPDSNSNESSSHGYIVYRIKPKSTLVNGDIINNSAGIYFDYNLPVQTNTEKTVVQNIVLPLQLLSFTAQRNDQTNSLKWSTSNEINTDHFEIQRGNNSRDFATIGSVKSLNNGKSKNDYLFTDKRPFKDINYYRLKMMDKDGKYTYSAIRSINNASSFEVTLYPNPVKNELTLNFHNKKTIEAQIEIVNAEGKTVLSKKIQIATGASHQIINTASLNAGSYFITCTSAEGQVALKFMKQQ